MTAIPTIVRVKCSVDTYLDLFLKNTGTSTLPTGEIIATQTSRDRTIKRLSIYNDTPLQPGETTKLVEQVFDAREIRFNEYKYVKSGEKQSFPMHGKIRKRRIPILLLWTVSP